jgi:hypothetical protein
VSHLAFECADELKMFVPLGFRHLLGFPAPIVFPANRNYLHRGANSARVRLNSLMKGLDSAEDALFHIRELRLPVYAVQERQEGIRDPLAASNRHEREVVGSLLRRSLLIEAEQHGFSANEHAHHGLA